ncbi:MAG: aquaporin [Candidatus Nanosyncoccaceae bacterium]
MANKKAKPKAKAKSKKTASKAKATKTPVNKRTTTRVVSAKTDAKEVKKGNIFMRFVNYTLMPNTIRMIVLELLGAFMLAVTFVLTQGHPMYMMFSVIAVFLVFSHATGGAFNPALTFGQWITRKICGAAMILQIVAQFLGGMLALVVLNAFIGAAAGAESAYGAIELFSMQEIMAGKEWYLFAAEVVGMIIIALALGRITKAKASNHLEKSLTVGCAVFAAMLLAGTAANYASGMSVLNPSILMTLQAFPHKNWVWLVSIYVIAPLLGGAIGYVLTDLLQEKASTKVR